MCETFFGKRDIKLRLFKRGQNLGAYNHTPLQHSSQSVFNEV